MKKIFNFFFISLIFIGCQTLEKPRVGIKVNIFEGSAMTMHYKIIVGKDLDVAQKKCIQNIIQETFAEIDSIYNKWNPESEIFKINRLKKNSVFPISNKLQNFLEKTEKLVTLSNGLFDPTIEPVQQLWKEALKNNEIPSHEFIEMRMQAVGFDKIHYGNGFIYKDHDDTSLDLGGIAKGYAVDLLVERLNDSGFSSLFVEWGGEIKALGKHPDNRPWHIFISHFKNISRESAIAHLDLKDEAIATSGDYLQNWTVGSDEKTTYFHIVHPKTGSLLKIDSKSIASASVVAKNCFVADAMATTLMLFGNEKDAIAWIEKLKMNEDQYKEIKFWIVAR